MIAPSVWIVAALLLADTPIGAEAEARVEATRRVLADETRPLDERASIALDEAATLDREAQAAPGPEARRARAALAIKVLDDFNAAHPRHGLETPLALQAAVYAWADGRRDLDALRLGPGDAGLKRRAIGRLDEAIARLDRLNPEFSGADPLVAQNGGFRTAQALVDRASLDPEGSADARDRLKKALAALEPAPTESAIEGHARLLRVEILAGLGELGRAGEELEAVAKLRPPVSPVALAEAQTRVLRLRRRYNEAIRQLDSAGVDHVTRDALALEVRLAQRSEESSRSGRADAEADAFRRAKTLRGSDRPEARLALGLLARALDEPPRQAEPEAWDLLGEAALGTGDPARASRLVARGADRAAGLHQGAEAARLRLRAGAILYQAGDFAGADPLLTRAWDDPAGSPSRARAGVLRALARGRAFEEGQGSLGRTGYVTALRDVVRAFPDDPLTVEARWLLAAVEADDGRPAEARRLWRSVPPGHPRWLAARLAVADQDLRELDELRIGDDPAPLRAKFREAAAFLRESSQAATEPSSITELDLASARLDLTPGVGRHELARTLCERLGHAVGSAEQHARARVFHAVALALTQRTVEAEREIRAETRQAPVADLLAAARLLDRATESVDTDAGRLRLGRMMRIITDGLAQGVAMPERDAAELRLRAVRAAILAGDAVAARAELRREPALDPSNYDLDGLRDLADALLRLDAPALAVEVERLRARRLKPGSPAWLESRYMLALALHRDGKPDAARSLIDASAILHPDLGGGTLKSRFERLRQRIDQE